MFILFIQFEKGIIIKYFERIFLLITKFAEFYFYFLILCT